MSRENNKQNMEDDKRLEVSRRYLLVTSLVLLALTMAKAELSKVNGLIFELTFETPERLNVLLAVGVAFLMLRYFSHASKYHRETFKAWSTKFMHDDLMFHYCEYSDVISGIAAELAPEDVDFNDMYPRQEGTSVEHSFKRKLVFNSCIVYAQVQQGHELPDVEVSILELWRDSKRDYFKVLGCMFRHWLDEIIHTPGVLYLYSPYLIGAVALASYLWPL